MMFKFRAPYRLASAASPTVYSGRPDPLKNAQTTRGRKRKDANPKIDGCRPGCIVGLIPSPDSFKNQTWQHLNRQRVSHCSRSRRPQFVKAAMIARAAATDGE